jgi:methylglutaconyl-CoA hydratase
MTYSQILYTVENRIARITLNRAEKRNALNPILIQELYSALDDSNNRDDIRVVILQAQGKSFCAGLDLEELEKISQRSTMENLTDSESLANIFRLIERHRKVIISKVQGLAIAGGCGLATAADIVIADKVNAKFCFSETKIGFVPAIVGAMILRKSRNAGVREMLLRANMISSDEAIQLGIINHSIKSSDLESFTTQLATEICSNTSPNAVELTKRLLWSVETMSSEDAMNFAVSLNALARTTDDLKKGVSSFLNKEKLIW